MKKLTFIVFVLGLTMVTYGQSNQDKQDIIQKCIDLAELQKYYHDLEVDGKKQLFIADNGIVPTDLNLVKFGNPVIFLKMEDMFFRNIKNHINFYKFSIDLARADVEFHYGIEGLNIQFKFCKEDGVWKAKEKSIKQK